MTDLYKLAKNTLFNNFKFNIKNQTKKLYEVVVSEDGNLLNYAD